MSVNPIEECMSDLKREIQTAFIMSLRQSVLALGSEVASGQCITWREQLPTQALRMQVHIITP
jgi:hypothetical protein